MKDELKEKFLPYKTDNKIRSILQFSLEHVFPGTLVISPKINSQVDWPCGQKIYIYIFKNKTQVGHGTWPRPWYVSEISPKVSQLPRSTANFCL